MERRSDIRRCCELSSLVLMFGCHFRAFISDWSPKGLRLELKDGLVLADREAFILHSGRFGVLHAQVIWRRDEEVGARIRNWRTAAVADRHHFLGLHDWAP